MPCVTKQRLSGSHNHRVKAICSAKTHESAQARDREQARGSRRRQYVTSLSHLEVGLEDAHAAFPLAKAPSRHAALQEHLIPPAHANITHKAKTTKTASVVGPGEREGMHDTGTYVASRRDARNTPKSTHSKAVKQLDFAARPFLPSSLPSSLPPSLPPSLSGAPWCCEG